ncbi:MAG: hypothetical protein JNL94_13560 [Planctomycetes bacterium]|nr:hypothetical protein [Planctomycetota bacterium]
MLVPFAWLGIASIASLGFASIGTGTGDEPPAAGFVVVADAPPSALPAPRDVVVVESVVVRGLPRSVFAAGPEIRSLDAAAEARLLADARAVDVLRGTFCPASATLLYRALTPSAHIVGDVYLRTHEDRGRLFVDVDVVRPPHELTSAAVLVERERSGTVGLSSATPWSIDGPTPGELWTTCAVALPMVDEPDESRVVLIRARRVGVVPGAQVHDWSTAESPWRATWRERAGAARRGMSTVVDFALMPVRDVEAFAPPASAVVDRSTDALQVFRNGEADPAAWADALRAIDNADGMVSTVELSLRALDDGDLGVASWCWNEDASWDVAFARAPDGSFRVHVAQTPTSGGVDRADFAFADDDRTGVVFVFAGHPTQASSAGVLVLAMRVREVEDPSDDEGRAAWDAVWDMGR